MAKNEVGLETCPENKCVVLKNETISMSASPGPG